MKKLKPSQAPIQQYKRLIEISREFASTYDLDSLLKRIIEAAIELSEAQAASVLLYDEKSLQLYFQAATGSVEPLMRGISVPLDGSVAGWVVQNRTPVVIPDVQRDPRYFGNVEKTTRFVTRSMIAVPMELKGKILGVLEVLYRDEGSFLAEDQELISLLGFQAAAAIENTRLFQQSDLISELVHELRTPLASLGTASYLLQRPEISDQQRKNLAKTVHTESLRLNELASSYLDLASLESGRMAFQMRPFDPLLLIDECRGVISSWAEESGVQLLFDLPNELPLIEGDRDKLKQVLLNLLNNAVKYNRSSGTVSIAARQVSQTLVISIRDTGIGISSEDQTRLFEKFFRSRRAEKFAPGSGLGLSISKRIIENHGGQIEVQSKVGEGSTFTVMIPINQNASTHLI